MAAAPAGAEDPVLATPSSREREILVRIARGYENVYTGNEPFIGEKTVRNHATRMVAKLGVGSSAQAIVLAKDGNLESGEGREPAR
jgi:DNA-binding NarL/FixJ family response regulator